MLRIRNLHASFDDHSVLEQINLDLARGEVLGLIGPNGSGKTSLLRCISGVHPSWEGEISLNDENLQTLSGRERAQQFAVVPQNAHLPPAFTVWESVSLGRTPHLDWLGRLGEKDLARIDWALSATELEVLKERRVSELSGGEQQRALLARALAQDAPVLLLDEPTAHLDLYHQVAFLSLVQRLAIEEDLALLIALHDLNLASIYADRLILLDSGRIQSSGSPSEVLTAENLQTVYRSPLIVASNEKSASPFVFIDKSKLA